MIPGATVRVTSEANDCEAIRGKGGEVVDMHRSARGTVRYIVRIDGRDYDLAGCELEEVPERSTYESGWGEYENAREGYDE